MKTYSALKIHFMHMLAIPALSTISESKGAFMDEVFLPLSRCGGERRINGWSTKLGKTEQDC
jgi:hypothetical protein